MGRGAAKAQSAMEYLLTYGWAILIVVVVIAALFSLGVFSARNLSSSDCVAETGFYCGQPEMNTSGYLGMTVGQASATAFTITGVGCSSSNIAPSAWSSTTSNLPMTMQPYQEASLDVQCTSSSSSTLGTSFSGSMWIAYTVSGSDQTQYAEVGTVSTKVNTQGLVGPAQASDAPTVEFGGTGGTGSSLSLSLPSGYNYYFCGGEESNGEIESTTWTADQSQSFLSLGHQTSDTCTITATGYGTPYQSLAGVAVGNVDSYTLRADGSDSSTSFSFNYVVGDSSQYTFIVMDSIYAFASISLPSGCSVEESENYGSTYSTVIAECYGQSATTYTVSGTTSHYFSDYFGYAVYSVD